jgi:hypothetical protein
LKQIIELYFFPKSNNFTKSTMKIIRVHNKFRGGWLLLLFALLIMQKGWGQLVINEICPRNAETISDEDGDFKDWFEIFNSGNEPINLKNWSVSDDITKSAWLFPDITLQPDSFLIVFASSKNRKVIVDHWETVIHAEDTWKYWMPDSEPDPAWKNLDFDDSQWLEGPGGFGRGDGDDNTILPDSVATVYLRNTFTVFDTSVISYVILHVDYDDAFVAYLNGMEIARGNIGWPGKIEAYTDYAWDIHKAVMYTGGLPEEFRIDMELFQSLIHEGENVMAIQGLNAWNNHGNSSLISFFTFGIENQSYTYQEIPEWFPNLQIYLHTDFNLSGEGESLVLMDTSQNVVDLVSCPILSADHSFGRETDGVGSWKYFGDPTPGISNQMSNAAAGYAKMAEFNLPSGFYLEPVQIGFINYQASDNIRYTTDGSIPGDTSLLYTGPFSVDTTTVIRARVFEDNLLPGDVNSNTYFIDFQTNLPVVSLSLNPHDLWDWEEGIYVMGPNAEPGFPHFGANFWQDWEKETHVEYFDNNQNFGFELDADMVIHGGFSRAYPMRSLRLITDGKYKTSEINYKLFKDKDINVFKRIILRNSGQDYNVTHFRDGIMHKIVQGKTDIDVQEYDPAVVFLNGVYWGIHNIREKIDRYYLQGNYGTNPDSVQILRDNIIVVEGNYYQYAEMIDYILHIPVIDSVTFDSISKLVNISNYSDYFITEMYFANFDWPNHNTKYWRTTADTSRWRYILTDIDFGLGLYAAPYTNELYRVLHGNIQWANNHKILRRIIQYEPFREYFINRSADLFNTVLFTQNILTAIDTTKQKLAPEMERHLPRWGKTFASWENEVEDMIDFALQRPGYVWQQYIDEFELEKLVNITVDVDSLHHGNVKVNTIIPDSLPWQGTYFDGNPVQLKALADSGYVFSHWASNSLISGADTLLSALKINVDTNETFRAFFNLLINDIDTPFIVINEINYRSIDSLDASDWLEIWNLDTTGVDLSGWIFKDGNDEHEFILPPNTFLDTGKYLVLCEDTIKFKAIHPAVQNYTGNFEFGLAREGEELRFFNADGFLLISMLYSNQPPWPTDADGTGKTIELDDPLGDLNDGNNWFSGCLGGSPGGPFLPCDTIGIEEIGNESLRVEVFPNPMEEKTQIKISTANKIQVVFQLFDNQGILQKNIEIQPLGNQALIELQKGDLASGVYFYTIYISNLSYSGKILIK